MYSPSGFYDYLLILSAKSPMYLLDVRYMASFLFHCLPAVFALCNIFLLFFSSRTHIWKAKKKAQHLAYPLTQIVS